MTRDEFNANRPAIYRKMVIEARDTIRERGTCSRGRILSTAKAIATKRFAKLESSVYSD